MSPEISDEELLLILLQRHGSPKAIYSKAKAVAGIRVGRPSDARRVCISALIDIVRESRVSHTGEKLNQYQLMKRAEEALLHKGIKVGSAQEADKDLDRTTLREATRRVLLFYCEENMENYTTNDWKWVKRHLSEAGRQKFKVSADSAIEHYQKAQEQFRRILDQNRVLRSLGEPVDPDEATVDEIYEAERKVRYWQMVRNLF